MKPSAHVFLLGALLALWPGSDEAAPPPEAALDKALQEMAKPEFAVRHAGGRKLFASGMSAVPALVAALEKAEAVGKARIPALAALQESCGGTPRTEELRHLLCRITGHASRDAKGWSTWLEKHKTDTRESLVKAELQRVPELLGAKSPLQRRQGLEILARLGDAKSLALAQPLLGDRDPFVRKWACRAYAEAGTSKDGSRIEPFWSDREHPLRREGLLAASLLGCREAKEALERVLDIPDKKKPPLPRGLVVLALARLGDEKMLPLAATGLGQRTEQDFHRIYAEALACFPRDKAVQALRKVLEDPQTEFPIMPAAALAALGEKGPEILKPVEAALKAPLPTPSRREPEARVFARQDRLLASRIVPDVMPEQETLMALSRTASMDFQKEVNTAIERGVKALRALQEKVPQKGELPGSWPFASGGWPFPSFKAGASSLALLALRKSGVPPEDPDFAQGLRYVLNCVDKPPEAWATMVYPQALHAILLSDLDPKLHEKRLKDIVRWLINGQITPKANPNQAGQWNYMGDPKTNFQASNSNTHFALLGICFASRKLKDFEIPKDFWENGLGYFDRVERLNGGWGYDKGLGQGDSYGTMTGVGVTSALICQAGMLGDAFQDFDARECAPIADGMDWLEERFEDGRTPCLDVAGNGSAELDWRYYWYYTIDRMALTLGTDYVGNRHWYHDIASRLLELQEKDGGSEGTFHGELPAVATSLALLVLNRMPLPMQIRPAPYDLDGKAKPYEVGEKKPEKTEEKKTP